MNLEPLWTPKQLGAFLGVSRSWIYAQTQVGKLPHLHIGGLIRFSPAAIRAWVDASASKPARVVE